MPLSVVKIGFGNVACFICTGVVASLLPNKKIVRSKSDLLFWSMNRIVQRETNVQIVARRNVKKQIFSK